MATSYHRRTRHSGADTDSLAFIFIILSVCAFWEHKALIQHIEHVIWYVFVTVACLIMAIFIVKVGKRLSRPCCRVNYDISDIDCMEGLEFERYVASLLKKLGYGAVRLTEKYDYGVDIIAVKNGVTWGIQVKRYSGLVKANAVRQVVTALRKYHCDKAMVITNSYYSEIAKDLARWNDCLLIDRDTLRHWVV
jgi:restriction system protein